ncbi:MAG TPA: hypothetical protein VMS64_32835 [Candidatus Methylomirabilis sp.]|nr:hypothetical protein [Candidatus Methylomirabilis sp.]
MKRRTLAVIACAWVLWVQTRTSGAGQPVRDAWEIVDTFGSQEDCERARVTIKPNTDKGEELPPARSRYVCFPDTLDPKATP